jgi:hypothetical protein
LSILFKATIKGRLAAFKYSKLSFVCSLTPSSAAITKIPISATLTPLCLKLLKAE